MKVVTAEQMRELDRRAMDEGGAPGVVLMENAGRAVVDLVDREYGPLSRLRAGIFCGGGNNGGDGFVIARLLVLAGAQVSVFCAPDTLESTRLKPDAAAHLKLFLYSGRHLLKSLPAAGEMAADSSTWRRGFDVAVDALLGTGIKDAPSGWCANAIRRLNALDCGVVAVDVPSGVNSDTGAAPGEAVRADHTVTFAYPKLGLLLHPGFELAGRLHAADIGFPWASLQPPVDISLLGCAPGRISAAITCSHSLREPDGWEKLLQKRPPESNKGDYGHVGILAGSRGMAGAPALVARAAQRSGAGLVTVLTAESAQPILAAKLDEQMTRPLPETDGAVAESALDAVLEFAQIASALCIGPGLTTHPETVRLVIRLVREAAVPVVLDADGLNALAQEPEAAAARSAGAVGVLVLTPHPGEAARLLGTSIAQVQSDRVGSVRKLARKFHAIAVLKGRHTLIASPDGAVCINTTGNPGMATGGMGDTLTGVIGALLAQGAASAGRRAEEGTAPLRIAALGVHLHGIAGDIAARAVGESGLTAGDVIDRLPQARSALASEA
jgi:ADP-dependent NAD(P)H-hydrate dehydratase / NAD(P)H-hydrate epimerase